MAYYQTPEGPELHYRAWGKGPPAMFLHPLMHDGSIWLDQLEGLKDIRTCIAPDLRGHGLSDPNPKPSVPLEDHVRDLVRLTDETFPAGKIDLVGISVGGMIASLFYEQRPERVRSLTLISSGFGDGPPDPAFKRYTAELARRSVVEGKDIVFRRWREYIVGPDTSLHAQARYKSMLLRTPVETMVAQLANGVSVPRPDLPAKIKVPVLVPIGDTDTVFKLQGAITQIPDLRTESLGSIARLPPLESPDALNAMLRRFWTSL